MAKRVQQRGSYRGPVDLLVEDEVIGAANAELVGVVEQFDTPDAAGGNEWIDGMRSWRGRLTGFDHDVAWRLQQAGVARLRTRDGRGGDFILTNTGTGEVTGSGEPPFDM